MDAAAVLSFISETVVPALVMSSRVTPRHRLEI